MKCFNIKAALIAAFVAAAAFLPGNADAQVVQQLPQFAAPRSVLDLGNGPTEIKILTGQIGVFTSQGSGIGSGSTTSITLTATPAIPPCVGCSISGGTLTTSSHVVAFNGTTTITTDTSQTIAASTPLAWGAACPAVNAQSGVPPQSFPLILLQAGQFSANGDLPLFTEARVCVAGLTGPGGQFVNFAIGAH